ncbi:MAG TPA: prepilin-type N-terminal cleavage/methylation domain-containing protein [bacterium]
MNRKLQLNKGFGLIELMVVVTIIGVLMLIAVPNFAGMQQRARIRSGSQEIAQDLRQIRERAVSLGVSFQINSPDQYHYQVINEAGNALPYKLGGTTGGALKFGVCGTYTGGFPPESSGSMPGDGFDFPGGTLTITNRGSATKGVIYINNGRDNHAVGVNSLGKIKVYRYANGNWYY